MESKNGLMGRSMKAITKMEQKLEKESSTLSMEAIIKVNFIITKSMEKVKILKNMGEYVWCENRKYVGEWQHNKMHGYGKIEWADGRKY